MNVKQLIMELQACGDVETSQILLRYPQFFLVNIQHVRCKEDTLAINRNIKHVLYLCEGGTGEVLKEDGGILFPLEEDEILHMHQYASQIGNVLTLEWQQKYDVFTEISLRFNDISLKEPDIESLVHYFGRITNNSVIIYDEFFNITLTTNDDLQDYDRQEDSLEKCSLANLFYYKQVIEYEDAQKGKRRCMRLLFPLLLRGSDPTPRGYLAIFDSGVSFDKVDWVTMELFANSALTELRRLLELRKIEERYVSDFLYDLVFRKTEKREEIIRRTKMLNILEKADYCIIALRDGNPNQDFRMDTNGYITKYEYKRGRMMNGIAMKIHERYQKDIITTFDENIFILHRLYQQKKEEDYDDMKEMCKWLEESIHPLFPESQFQMGIGTIVERIDKIASSYHHALFALSYGRVLSKQDQSYLVAYNESGLLKIFSVLQETDTLMDIIPNNLIRIRQYDQKSKSNLYETLKIYLSCNCNAKKASQQLFVHYKTMIYRLEKLAKDFDIQLEQNSLRFHIELGIQLLEILDIREEQ